MHRYALLTAWSRKAPKDVPIRLHSVSPFSVTAAGGTIIQSSRSCATSVGAMPAPQTLHEHIVLPCTSCGMLILLLHSMLCYTVPSCKFHALSHCICLHP